MTISSNNDDIVVIEISGQYLQSLSAAFNIAFPTQRDNLLARMPEIRRQFQRFEDSSHLDPTSPGHLALSRQDAQRLALLLGQLATPSDQQDALNHVLSEIQQKAQHNTAADPDFITLLGTRFAWSQPVAGSGDPHYILIELHPEPGEDQQARIQKAIIGRNSLGNLMCRMAAPLPAVPSIRNATPTSQRAHFTARITRDATMQLDSVTPVKDTP